MVFQIFMMWSLLLKLMLLVVAFPQMVIAQPKYSRLSIQPTSTAFYNPAGKYVKLRQTSTTTTKTHTKGVWPSTATTSTTYYFNTTTLPITIGSSTRTLEPASTSVSTGTTLAITPVLSSTTSTSSLPFFSSTPSNLLSTTSWTTPTFASTCTDGPKPSYSSTIHYDDIKVDWWYVNMPENYQDMNFRNFRIYDARIVDPEWSEMATSKFNFAVHGPNEVTNVTGDPDYSGFIALPDGATFDVISFWIQCDYGPCQIRLFETGFDLVERELFLKDGSRLTLPGGFTNNDGMKYLNMEDTFGFNAGKKVRWLRMYAEDLRDITTKVPWRTFSGEVSIGLDDLAVVRRVKLSKAQQGCVEAWDNLTRLSL